MKKKFIILFSAIFCLFSGIKSYSNDFVDCCFCNITNNYEHKQPKKDNSNLNKEKVVDVAQKQMHHREDYEQRQQHYIFDKFDYLCFNKNMSALEVKKFLEARHEDYFSREYIRLAAKSHGVDCNANSYNNTINDDL